MNKFNVKITTILIFSMLLLSACSGTAALVSSPALSNNVVTSVATPQPTIATTSPITPPAMISDYEKVLEDVYTFVSPSVVNIRVVQKQVVSSTSNQQFPGFPFLPMPGFPNGPDNQTPQYSQALGSGFIWDTNGYIVTNNHVIDGASKIEVTFADGTAVPAKLVGADAYADLAVIKVDAPASLLHPVSLGDSTQTKVGQLVIAIGNPFGLKGSMTVGIVSALGRTIPAQEATQSGPVYSIPDIIQTDAPINPGNSGGVLVNDQGQLIGVTAAIESPVSANAGIGFAIPSALVSKVIPGLIKTGHYDHSYIGISGTTLTLDISQAMKLKAGQRGALVEDVAPGGPADKAGLRGSDRQVTIDGQDYNVGGDVITAVDGVQVNTMDDLIAYLSDNTVVGQKVTLSILRNDQLTSVEVTLEARPNNTGLTTSISGSTSQTGWLGVGGVTLSSDIAKAMGLNGNQEGVLVQQVAVGSPADLAGLHGSFKPVIINGSPTLIGGDILVAADGQTITSLQDLESFLGNTQPGQTVTLTIIRDQQTMGITLTLGSQPTNP
jgi:serine protease Do